MQPLNQKGIVVEVTDLAAAKKKSVIRVLHVDDDSSIREISKLILMEMGSFDIDNACCVDEAFKKLSTEQYDVVISDYEMPQKDGLQFLKELREQQNDIPFVLFTGKGREDVAVKALNLGADSYINKQGSPETVYCELAHAINNIAEQKKSKKALVESELKYRTMVESSLQGLLIIQTSPLRLVFANDSMGRILGYSVEELKSLSPKDVAGLIHSEDSTVFFERFERRLRGESAPSSLEFRGVRKDGSIVWLEGFSSRIEYMGQPAVQGIFLDIDERKKFNEILRESEQRYRELANSLPNIVFESDKNGHLEFVNSTAKEITGFSNEDLEKGLNILQFLVPEDRQRAIERIQRLLSRGSCAPAEYVFLRKDGTTFPALITTTLRISQNKVTGLRGAVIDITESKKNDLGIRQKNEVLERVTESIGSGLAVIGKDYRIVWANKQLRDLGATSNKKCYQTLNRSDTICPDCGVKKVFEQNVSLDVHEYKTINSKGETIWIELRVTPLRDKDGKVTAALELAVPITERKKAEEKTEKNQKELDLIFNSSPIIVFYKDKEGKFLRANKAFAESLQIPPEELVGKTVFDFYSTEIAQNMTNDDLEVLKSGCPRLGIIEQYESASGLRSVQTDKVPILDENGTPNGIIGFAQDITERKKAEKALLESQQKYKALFSANPEATVFTDNDLRIVEANSRFSRLFGYSFDEVKGKIITDVIVPDESKEESRIVRQQILSGPIEIVTSRRRKDGSLIPLFMSGGPALVNGKVIGSIMVYKDISDIITVQEELSKTLDKAEMLNEKLRVVGSLTRHDVGNKLMIVKSNIYLLKKQIGDNPKLAKYLEGIDSAIKSSDEMFEFSRFYEKIGVEQPSEVDVAQCFNQAVALLPDLGNVKIVNDCQGLEVMADSLLKKLFYNFLDNSLKHGEKVTQIRLHFTTEADGLKLFYEDNGVGVSEADKPKLFHEGFSRGKSTGLGLFLIKKMIEVYGWTTTEEGDPGNGAKFTITIPKLNKNGKENYQIAP